MMKYFKLPDLGEGLPDAEIRQWHVKPGDQVHTDQVLVSMETAKAVVDVPSPFSGVIEQLHGNPGDTIKVGSILVSFEGAVREDSGTVVGTLESTGGVIEETAVIIKSQARAVSSHKATPAVKALAQRLGVDLSQVQGTGPNGLITAQDVKSSQSASALPEGFELIKGSRRVMMKAMADSHAAVCPVTIFDEADISGWAAEEDISVRLVRAIVHACRAEPSMNASFDGQAGARRMNANVNLGLAVDSNEGLFVPVIHAADQLINDPKALRALINEFKITLRDRTIEAAKLTGATITLSNFGTFAGRFATPVVVPPQVAIIGCGAKRETVVAKQGSAAIVPMLPLSITFDHRAVTGGEATRFMGALIADLQKSSYH
jgi:2-oxoisovalerate dehydrogenase E2 component (dihydrolipoyl transacylase)